MASFGKNINLYFRIVRTSQNDQSESRQQRKRRREGNLFSSLYTTRFAPHVFTKNMPTRNSNNAVLFFSFSGWYIFSDYMGIS